MRQECLDWFTIFTYRQLRRIVKSYVGYYNNCRPHQGLKGIPNGPPKQELKDGVVKRKPLLFGLHSHYYRQTA
jgi:hypothetical protein